MKTCSEPLNTLEQTVLDALLKVIDPEAGENIVDLGLVYGIEVENNAAKVNLTMTSPACPVGEMLLDDIHSTLSNMLPDEIKIDINLVWDPPWSPDMISNEAKQRLGWS